MSTNYGLPLNLPVEASAHARQLDNLTAIVHWFMIVLFVGWGIFFVYSLFRFRKGRNPVASYEGAKGHFSTYGEAAVVLVEVALLVGFAVPIWAARVGTVPDEQNAVRVRIVAEQFAWNAHYPGADGVFGRTDSKLITAGMNPLGLDPKDAAGKDDVVTINQLHLPVNRKILINLSSKDVIHSFSLPQMRVKQDAIPGQTIPIWFEPILVTPPENSLPGCAVTKTCWEIACAQLCGLTHYRMRGFYQIHDAAGYEAWLSENAPKVAALPTPPAPTGEPVTPTGAAVPGENPAGSGGPQPGDQDSTPPAPPAH
ncbi:MAG: cytochrome c oxidase subunit [Acidobacteriota bacterium]|jgi:cytochrome c oxidase subunit 2|nr:cytochrome c oxidase subunit [Acidobacteriota bacterium]